MSENPYEAPSANLSGNESFGEQAGGVTHGVVDQLRRTKGWTRFSAVLAIILGVILLLGAVMGGGAVASASRGLRGFGAFAGIILFVYGLLGLLYLVAGIKLSGFSSAVQRLMYSGQERDLEDALDRQRSFWVFIGVILLVSLIIAIITLVTTL